MSAPDLDIPSDEAPSAATSWLARMRDAPLGMGLRLGIFALATALILSLSHTMTREAIAARMAEDLAASLAQVVPAELHDNDLTAKPLTIEDAQEGTFIVYRGTLDGVVTAVAFEIRSQGYSGEIRTLVGLDPAGRILGTRVLSHTETPGLGDKIEIAKSDWILGFDGLSLATTRAAEWRVKRDGGRFDQFSGATITPRSVVGGVHRALGVFDRNRTDLLRPRFGDIG